MAAEASVALMHRITNIRLPSPLPGDGDQRYAIDLDDQGLICRIEAMEADANEPGADRNYEILDNHRANGEQVCQKVRKECD